MEPLRDGDPRQVGSYGLEGRLGGGGMGQVFLGRSRSGRKVAVKLVRPELADDAGFLRRFALEVDAARRVGGFYTAQVVDAAPEATPPWLVTAYIPGPSLQEAVERHGPLSADVVAVLGAGLAEGLAAIHSCGLVHRDLKPSNVILADDGPRVIDFGIARALDATSHTLSRAVVGTPSFMSPEQARGQEIGGPSDVFSLGLVLAFAATGRSPFGTGAAEAMVYRLVHDEPDLAGLPAPLADLVARCLAKEPADRPEVAEILEELAGSAAATPFPSSWLPPAVATMVAEHSGSADGRVPPPVTRNLETPGTTAPVGMAAMRRQGTAVTAVTAMVLAFLCIPGLIMLTFTAADFVSDPSAPTTVILANLVLAVAAIVAIITGSALLSQRKRAGRRLLAITGVVVALQGLSASLQFFITGANVSMLEDGPLWSLLFVAAPLTAIAGVGSVIAVLRPATARWCLAGTGRTAAVSR
ncbi:serine/threonine-protein kinase [Saccharomonospora sp. NPDC006951]